MSDKSLIKFVTVKKHIDKRRLEVEYFDVKGKKTVAIIPYGMFCKIASEINGIALQQEAMEDSLFCIPIDLKNIEDLQDDEVAFGIPSKASRIYFKNDDKINMYAKDNLNISGDKKITLDAAQNIELITEQKLLLKNTAETLKGLIDTFIDAFNNLAVVTQSTSSANPDTGHTHAILITGVTNALATLKTRFASLLGE